MEAHVYDESSKYSEFNILRTTKRIANTITKRDD